MQTFLPMPGFEDSAEHLDPIRLRNQRRESLSILRSIFNYRNGGKKGWYHHPATQMWVGHERCLINYTWIICEEVIRRGDRDNVAKTLRVEFWPKFEASTEKMPWWMGDERLHKSHRQNLIRKDPDYYWPMWPKEVPSDEYWWPSQQSRLTYDLRKLMGGFD